MLKNYAALYLFVGYRLSESELKLYEWALKHPEDNDVVTSDHPIYAEAIGALNDAKTTCDSFSLGTLSREITRALEECARGGLRRDRLLTQLGLINRRFYDELENREFLYVPSDLRSFYGQRELFGSLVSAKFKKSGEDIEHAGNCYALGESTACILHLMRAMEAAVTRLSVRLGISISPRDTWGSMLGKMDNKIRLLPDTTTAQKRKKENWSEARVNLYHVKEAWRNPSMHPKRTYTLDQAREVLEAVRVFMTRLAKL